MKCRIITSQTDHEVNRHQWGFAVAILFICACIFLQVLGTPVGLIDLLDAGTTVESNLSEGFTILSTPFEVSTAGVGQFIRVSDSSQYQLSLANSVFHPPQS